MPYVSTVPEKWVFIIIIFVITEELASCGSWPHLTEGPLMKAYSLETVFLMNAANVVWQYFK
jgi:hypothetical protein